MGNSANKANNELFSACLMSGDEATVRQLIGRVPDINWHHPDRLGMTFLHAATFSGSVPVVNLLLSAGADIRAKDENDWTCLHWACLNGHYQVIEYLLQNSSLSLNDTNKYGQTPVDLLKDDSLYHREEKEECLRQLKANGYYSDSSEDDDKQEVIDGQEEHKIDYKPFLKKAAANGTVKTKRSNLGLSGASGTGKTSTILLLTDQDPVYEHDSTPVLKPMVYFNEVESDNEQDDDDEAVPDQPLEEEEAVNGSPAVKRKPHAVSAPKQYMLMSNKKNKWSQATQEVLIHRLASCVCKLAELQSQSTDTSRRVLSKVGGLSLMMKGGFFSHRLGSLADDDEGHGNSKRDQKKSGATPLTITSQCVLSMMSFDDLQATQDILEFIERSTEGLKDLGEIHFVNVSDSGGQAAFMDIAPALMRFHSVNLLLIKLDEELDKPVQFFYSIKGKVVGHEDRNVTTKSLLYSMISSKSKVQKVSIKGLEVVKSQEKSIFMILGTHLDKYDKMPDDQESLDQKEEKLKKLLKEFDDCIVSNGDKLIFTLDTRARDPKTCSLANQIRKIALEHYVEAEVPVTWYILQVAITQIKVSSKNRDLIHVSRFVEIGVAIKMSEDEVRAALQYFHEMSICLYYPGVLPNVVFATPQFLFEKITELMSVTLNKQCVGVTRGSINKLRNQGIFTKSLLEQVSTGFEEDLFTPDDFLKLMTHLFIISCLPDTDEYFIPCVLETTEDPLKNLPESEIPVQPLAFTWNNSVPNGLFPSLTTSMQKSSQGISFTMSTTVKQYRNRITFNCPKLACVVTLIEYNAFIAVCLAFKIREYAPKVCNAVLSGIEAVVKRFDWLPAVAYPEKAFICDIPGCKFQDGVHLCYPDTGYKLLSCSLDSMVSIEPTEDHLLWEQSGQDISTSDNLTQSTIFTLLQDKSSRWDSIGQAFGVSLNDRDGLRTDISLSNDARLERVISKWLESAPSSKPLTWSDFIHILSDSLQFNDVVRRVQTFLKAR